jgi:hypothetical protein
MKETDLKKLTKFVLNEIYQEPAPEHPLVGLVNTIFGRPEEFESKHPAFRDLAVADRTATEMITKMGVVVKTTADFLIKRDKDGFYRSLHSLHLQSGGLMNFIVYWAQHIHKQFPDSGQQLDETMQEFKTYFDAICGESPDSQTNPGQAMRMFISISTKNDLGKQNYINALKEYDYLKELFEKLKVATNNVFDVGAQFGYNKKEKKV